MAGQAQMPPPDDLAAWSLHCFCINARATPHAVIRFDDNGRILFHARNGASIGALRERGMACGESQLALLAAYDLIAREGDSITTRFPVLGPETMAGMRRQAQSIAERVLDKVIAPAGDIVDRLRSAGLAASGRAVVFGYALDGLAWEALRARGLLPETELTIERPFWNGTFWAAYPPRPNAAGINEVREDGAALVMMWTDAVAGPMAALAGRPEVRPFLRSLRRANAAAAAMAELTGGDGMIPIVRPSDPIHGASRLIAAAVSAAIPDGRLCRSIFAEAGAKVRAEDAVVILAHETIWEVLALLDEAGILDPVLAEPSNLAPYLFVRMPDATDRKPPRLAKRPIAAMAGRARDEGKDYVVAHGDVMLFKFNL